MPRCAQCKALPCPLLWALIPLSVLPQVCALMSRRYESKVGSWPGSAWALQRRERTVSRILVAARTLCLRMALTTTAHLSGPVSMCWRLHALQLVAVGAACMLEWLPGSWQGPFRGGFSRIRPLSLLQVCTSSRVGRRTCKTVVPVATMTQRAIITAREQFWGAPATPNRIPCRSVSERLAQSPQTAHDLELDVWPRRFEAARLR